MISLWSWSELNNDKLRSKHFEDLTEFKDVVQNKGTAPGKWINGGGSEFFVLELWVFVGLHSPVLHKEPNSDMSKSGHSELLMKTILHFSDISNPAKPIRLATLWSVTCSSALLWRDLKEYVLSGPNEFLRNSFYRFYFIHKYSWHINLFSRLLCVCVWLFQIFVFIGWHRKVKRNGNITAG